MADIAPYYAWVKQYTANNLIKNQELHNPGHVETTLGSTYNQALAIITATAVGDKEYVERLGDALIPIYAQGYHGAYDVITGSDLNSDEYVGNNSWVLLALCHYEKRYSTGRYTSLANQIATWIENLYDNGAFTAGTGNIANMIVTEGQIDAIAALRAHTAYYGVSHGTIADDAENYLFTTLKNGNKFYAGSTDGILDSTQYLDTVLWAGLMTYDNSSTITTMLSSIDDLEYTYNGTLGYMDMAGSNRIFVPGYAYLSLLNGSSLSPMETFVLPSFVAGSGIKINSNNPAWTGADVSLNSETTLWYLLASLNINPFKP